MNEIIKQNLDVTEEHILFRKANEIFNLQKIEEKDNPNIRIIKVGEYDSCPCIGEHVKNTKEIGEFKITTTNYNEGNLRIRFKVIQN